MSPSEVEAHQRAMAALLLREQTAKTEKAESEARVAAVIEEAVREHKNAVELPKVVLGGAS